jgi:DNA-binding IclR family transcriptional regulator
MVRGKRKPLSEGSSVAVSTTVQKAVGCLDALAKLGGTASASDIALSLGISRPGANRLLETLVVSGVLTWDDDAKRYGFGMRLYEWGALANPMRRLMPAVRREAVKLAKELGRRVDVLLADMPDVIHAEINDHMDGLVMTTPSHHRAPWWRTASGKVLAAMGPPELTGHLIADAIRSGQELPESPERIEQEFIEIKERGYGLATGTYSNTIGVVVPVFDSSEYAVATLTVPAAREEFTESNQAVWLSAARLAAARASAQLGSRSRIIMGVV